MAFSDGFNNTLRSLDSAFKWRAAQEENARQFDTTHAENVRVNDSRIDLNDAQIARLRALTKLSDQEVDFNDQMNPLKVENQGLINEGQRGLNEGRRLTNETAQLQLDENRATSGTRVAATNAQNRFTAFDEATKKHEGRATNSKNLMLSLAKEDGSLPTGQELVSDPKAFARAIATMSASSEITDGGFDANSIALMMPHYENGQLAGYIAVEESTPGGPLRVDPEAVDENGQPRIIPLEEAAQIYDAMVTRLDQSASWGAKGGSARDRMVLGQADAVVRGQLGSRPSPQALPKGFENLSAEQIEAEGTRLQAELDNLEAQRASLAKASKRTQARRLGLPGNNGRFGNFGPDIPLTEDEKQKMAELDSQTSRIRERLGQIGAALQTMQDNAAVPEQQSVWDTQLETGKRRLGDTVRRNEALTGANYTAEQTRNLMTTGRADKTPKQAQADFAERVSDVSDMVAETAVGQHRNTNTGKWTKEDYAVSAQALQAQVESLAYSNPTFAQMVRNPQYDGLMRQLGMNAMALAGPGGTPNLLVAYQLFQENVDTTNLGRIMQRTFAMVNPEGGTMGPEEQARVGKLAAAEIRANPDASPDAIAQRVKLRIRNGG